MDCFYLDWTVCPPPPPVYVELQVKRSTKSKKMCFANVSKLRNLAFLKIDDCACIGYKKSIVKRTSRTKHLIHQYRDDKLTFSPEHSSVL